MKMKSVWPLALMGCFASSPGYAQEREVIVQMPPAPKFSFVLPTPASCPQMKYPIEALRYALEGLVVVSLLVDEWGAVWDSGLVKSSGWKILDQTTLTGLAACGLVPGAHSPPLKGRHWIKMGYMWTLYSPGETRPSKPVLLADTCASTPALTIADDGATDDTIYLRILISKEGQAYGAKLEQGIANAAAENAAIAQVQTCRYTPSTLAGKPVNGNTTIRYRYKEVIG